MSSPNPFICLFVVLVAVQVGCATAELTLPRGASVPFRNFQGLFDRATDACRGVRTMQLAISVNARSGETRLRGDVLAALARPSSLRLVGVASFGAPGFVLVARPTSAVLVLPRDQRVVEGAPADQLLAALTGLQLGADDFRAMLTGCLVPEPRPSDGRVHENGWIAVTVEREAIAYVEPVQDTPVVVAGTRPGLDVWYSDHVRGLPRRIDVRAVDTAGVVTDLTAILSQVSINIDLHPDAFVAQIRDDYVPMTLDQFRGVAGPLEAPGVAGPPPQ